MESESLTEIEFIQQSWLDLIKKKAAEKKSQLNSIKVESSFNNDSYLEKSQVIMF